jgi:8-oxo-dGTP diphosphatase
VDTKVGIGVAILKSSSFNTQVLLGKRKGSHGEGEWGFPGGHLEYMESFNACALREIAEECGPDLKVSGLEVVTVMNLTQYQPKHYLDVGMVAGWVSGDPVITEPDKCTEWKWFDLWDFDNASPRFATVDKILYLLGSWGEDFGSQHVKVYDCA